MKHPHHVVVSEDFIEPYLKRLDKCIHNEDEEIAHHIADGVLCDLLVALGFIDVVNKWDEVKKWYA